MSTPVPAYGFNLPAATVQGIQAVVDAMSAAGAIASASGLITYVDVIASRNLLASDIGKLLRNTTASDLVITMVAGVAVTGNALGTKHTGAGKLSFASGGGVTVVDAGGLAAAQVTDGAAILWEFDSATRVVAS